MIVKIDPEDFMQIAFAGQSEMNVKMSSACSNGHGRCKCSPRRETLKLEQTK